MEASLSMNISFVSRVDEELLAPHDGALWQTLLNHGVTRRAIWTYDETQGANLVLFRVDGVTLLGISRAEIQSLSTDVLCGRLNQRLTTQAEDRPAQGYPYEMAGQLRPGDICDECAGSKNVRVCSCDALVCDRCVSESNHTCPGSILR